MIGRPSPSASAREAKLCRMSWMRTSWSPARTRIDAHAPSMSVMCVPGLAPGMTQRLPGLGGRASRTRTADGDKWTVRAPVFPSLRQRINLICCKRTIIFVSGESCTQDECGCHQSSDPLWTQLAPDGNAVARGASVRSRGEGRDESAGAGASLRCSYPGVTARGGARTTARTTACASHLSHPGCIKNADRSAGTGDGTIFAVRRA